jgi:SAM-dependent methyltransferase
MKRLVCYAHFDVNGEVKPFVKHALNTMQSHCAATIFVSNSPVMENDKTELLLVCSQVLINSNSGYDFYMWKLALEKADLSLYDEVILMNSSVYGPVSDMSPVFADMKVLECDFWGITECFQTQPHIQSYFLVFRRRVIESQAFRDFWDGVLPYVNKTQVILSYEIGLTQWLLESGFKPGVFCSFEKLGNYCQTTGKRLRKKDNTSVKHALELLNIGSPFIKRDAVRNLKVDIAQVLQYLQQQSYPAELINEQTQQVEKHCPLCDEVGTIYRKGVKDYIWLHNIKRYDYYRCNSSACGVVWVDGNGMKNSPVVVHPQFQSAIHPSRMTFPAVLKKCTPGNILILGCDNEHSWSRFSNAGQKASSNYTISFSTHDESGEVILTPGVSNGEELFDNILVTNGFEMSADPLKELSEYIRLLKPGGSVYLQTPNMNSPLSSIFRIYWYGLNAPRSKFLFNRKSLKNILSRSGFINVKVTTDITRANEYLRHSFNISRNKWTSTSLEYPSKQGVMAILKWLAGIINFFFGGFGEDLIGIARKPI